MKKRSKHDEDSEDEKPAKKKKKGKKKTDDKPEKKAKKKESSVETDAWGCRTPTRSSRINKVLMKASKPLTVKQIEEKADATSIHSHLSRLKGEGFIKKDDEGKFVATKLGKKKAAG